MGEFPLPKSPPEWGLLLTAVGIVVWVVYALLRGNLVSRRVMDERIKDWEARLAQALETNKFWKEAAEARQDALTEMTAMLRDIADSHKTILRFIEATKKIAESGGEHGG